MCGIADEGRQALGARREGRAGRARSRAETDPLEAKLSSERASERERERERERVGDKREVGGEGGESRGDGSVKARPLYSSAHKESLA